MKYNSLAAAVIGEKRVLRSRRFLVLPNEALEEIDAKDDNLFEEVTSLLSRKNMAGAAKEPTEDMPAKVDAIFSVPSWLNNCNNYQK